MKIAPITLEPMTMLRTHPAHIGTAPLSDVHTLGREQPAAAQKKLGTFESYVLEAINSINNKQLDVDSLARQYVTDPDSVNVEDVTIAMAKAQQSLSLAQTVIDRLTTGWNELSTTR